MNAEQIQALLNGATPGDWREGQDGNNRVYGPDGAGEHSGLIAVAYKGRPNARLIAAVKPIAQAALAAMAELGVMKTAGIVEVAARNPSVLEYMEHWEGRATKAEAERDALQARVKALESGLKPFADIRGFSSGVSDDDIVHVPVGLIRAARALLSKGSPEKKPTDYEIKVAQKEKDFPNGF